MIRELHALEAQRRLADADDIPGLKDLLGDGPVVDHRAADAVEVGDDDVRAPKLDPAVETRDVQIVEARHGLPAAADDQRLAGK